jgi:hypothetical protein
MGTVEIDPATGAPIVKPFVAPTTSKESEVKVTAIPGAPDARDNQKDTTKEVAPGNAPLTIENGATTSNESSDTKSELNEVELLEKEVADLQQAVIDASQAAHDAHQKLMDAQRKLMFARAH